MKAIYSLIVAVILMSSCSKEDEAMLGMWTTESLQIATASTQVTCEASLDIARSTDDDYIIIHRHEGKVLTFVSTSVSDGIVSIESVDDELNWIYAGDMRLVDDELVLSYGYKNLGGSELPRQDTSGTFQKE